MRTRGNTELGWLALFTSTGTSICCALPIMLVTLLGLAERPDNAKYDLSLQ